MKFLIVWMKCRRCKAQQTQAAARQSHPLLALHAEAAATRGQCGHINLNPSGAARSPFGAEAWSRAAGMPCRMQPWMLRETLQPFCPLRAGAIVVSRDEGVLALSWGVPGHRRKEEKGFFVPKRKSCGAAKQNGGGIFEMLQESKPAARGELQGHPAAPMISPMPRLVLLPRGGLESGFCTIPRVPRLEKAQENTFPGDAELARSDSLLSFRLDLGPSLMSELLQVMSFSETNGSEAAEDNRDLPGSHTVPQGEGTEDGVPPGPDASHGEVKATSSFWDRSGQASSLLGLSVRANGEAHAIERAREDPGWASGPGAAPGGTLWQGHWNDCSIEAGEFERAAQVLARHYGGTSTPRSPEKAPPALCFLKRNTSSRPKPQPQNALPLLLGGFRSTSGVPGSTSPVV
ncbi:hypothetical protein Anapl_01373 [Anas platyrhynchos]|uniref:Cdc42 effector-like domain-containing protein n=1 Tax=Anas platyrhynchos TaxID=8839 RepID=R0LU78_ANAPL|nr:hypothetical protein Anapl_01373 [Anas platyrhynchos]